MLQRLVDGAWNRTEFLVLAPGETIESTHDESLMRAASFAGPLSPTPTAPRP
jgi:hypothetical protein